MEINKIIQFRTVFETESIREAANILNMSPGSLSKAIKSLESEVEIKLFVQKGRNIMPTDEAQDFYHKSTSLIESYENLIGSKTNSQISKQKHLTIASWEVFTSYFMSHIAEAHFSDYRIRAIERTPHALEKSILKGEADIGISYAPIAHKDLSLLKITQFQYGVYAKKGAFKNFDKEDIPFAVPITVFSGSPTGIRTLDDWPSDNQRKIKYEFELLETALQTTRRGLSAIHCPDFIIKLQNKINDNLVEIDFIKPRKKQKHDIFIVTRKSTEENLEVKRLAKALRLVCK